MTFQLSVSILLSIHGRQSGLSFEIKIEIIIQTTFNMKEK